MSKSQSPLVGYNTNVRHKGKPYHIQTEDSGYSRPHIITHIFADGGRIVASRKTDYSKHLNEENLEDIVRNLMKEQHKNMLIGLRNDLYEESTDAPTPQTSQAAPPDVTPSDRPSREPKPDRSSIPSANKKTARSVPPSSKLRPSRPPDMEALDKAAEARIQRSSLRSVLIPGRRKSQPPPPAVAAPPVRVKKESDARVSKPRIVSIFGSDPSNEKSLDDVIISYLTDDDRKKK